MLLVGTEIPADVIVQSQLTAMRIEEWLREDVFRFNWWFLLSLFIISSLMWWRLVDKTRLNEISIYAAFTIIITLVLDEIGEEFVLWVYPNDIFPIFPPLTAVDIASLPVIYSLIYQYFKTWKSFVLATLVMATLFCFILEPTLVKLGLYQMLIWKSFYGFPIYTLIALFIRWLVIKIFSITESYNKIS